MIAIKHRYTSATICEFDVATVREAAIKAGKDGKGAKYWSETE